MLTKPVTASLSLLAVAAIIGTGYVVLKLDRYSAQDTVSQSFTTTGRPSIVVETFNGAITVMTSEQGRVKAKVTRRARGQTQADADSNLDTIDVAMNQQGHTI